MGAAGTTKRCDRTTIVPQKRQHSPCEDVAGWAQRRCAIASRGARDVRLQVRVPSVDSVAALSDGGSTARSAQARSCTHACTHTRIEQAHARGQTSARRVWERLMSRWGGGARFDADPPHCAHRISHGALTRSTRSMWSRGTQCSRGKQCSNGFSIAPQALEGLPGVRHVQPNHSEVGVPLASRTIRPPSPPRLCLVSRACTHP